MMVTFTADGFTLIHPDRDSHRFDSPGDYQMQSVSKQSDTDFCSLSGSILSHSEFVSELDIQTVNITATNFAGLQWLCEEL
jgi:hypothetical protein